ncbi:MAG TPA: hypothetical protein VGF32_23110 [Streptosporangiaceae bacterium]
MSSTAVNSAAAASARSRPTQASDQFGMCAGGQGGAEHGAPRQLRMFYIRDEPAEPGP